MKLFETDDLQSFLRAQPLEMKARIDCFTDDEIMANDLTILAHNVCEEFRIDPLVLHDEDVERRSVKNGKIQKWYDPVHYWMPDGRGAYREVDGVTITFVYPFGGSELLFYYRASTFSMSSYPDVGIRNGALSIQYAYATDETRQEGWKDRVLRRLEKDISTIKQGIEWSNKDVASYNMTFSQSVMSMLRERKSKIEDYYKVAQLFDVSVKANERGARIISPVKRQLYPIAHEVGCAERNFGIEATNYREILAVLKDAGSTMERTPNSYRSMGEEDLRNVLLASLNSSFKGAATGEAFRNNGKTDICIEAENRAAFVAECKMWTGEKEVPSAIDQLDSYLTWRDCKTALIYFVRRKDFLSVAKKMGEVLRGMSGITQVQQLDANEYDCTIISSSCPGQRKIMRVFMFNLAFG